MINHSRWTQLELYWLQRCAWVNLNGRFAGTELFQGFSALVRRFPYFHFLHDSVSYILPLSPQLLPNYLPARIYFLLEPLSVVLSLHPGFLDHLETPLIDLPLNIFLRLCLSMTGHIRGVARVDPQVFFVGGVIQQLVEVRTHSERLGRGSGLGWSVVLEREFGEGLLFV